MLLLVRPELDVQWEDHPSHFWLVLSVALVNVALGLLAGSAAARRGDARVFLVSLVLLSSAGFLALHALATPGVLLKGANSGFVVATPIGLLLAAVLAASSSMRLDDRRFQFVDRNRSAFGWGLAALLAAWAAASLLGLPVLKRPFPEEAPVVLRAIAPVGVLLYGFAALRYVEVYRARRRTLPLAVAVAFVLLAEAMIAVVFSRSWHASWWEWHVLMVFAFGAITAGARAEYRREQSVTAAFGGLYLEGTLERLDRRHSDALMDLVTAIGRQEPVTPILERLRKEGFTGDELAVLERSAHELRRVNELFRPYVGATLAQRLEQQPELARLGGTEHDVSVLFADLAGFTPFSEGRSPEDVIQMLNAYWSAAVPLVVEGEGGLIERFAGDAILVIFNAVGDQPDHVLRACRAGLALQNETGHVWEQHPDWPRFRVGVNTGPAVVGNVGGAGQRSFTVIGDTTNVAARIQAVAEPGDVLVSAATYERLGDRAAVEPLGPFALKGKRQPIQLYRLVGVRAD